MPKTPREPSFARELGANLRQARIDNEFSQQELASALNITHQQVSKYENGTNRISVERLMDWSRLTNRPYQGLIP